MRFVFLPIGTYGDLSPFLEIGAELRARGHDVLVGTAAGFRENVEARGLRFASILSDAAHRAVLANPLLWHRRKFFETYVRGWMCPTVKPIVSLVESQPRPEELVLVSAMCGGPGARTAGELTGARTVSLWAYPAEPRSAIAPPVMSSLEFLPLLPYALRRALLWAVDRNADRLAAGSINRVRQELGLAPVRNVLHWLGSTYRQLALFPDWYCPRQRDWPAHLEHVGFPLAASREALSREVEGFLANGKPPVVITFGTGMRFGHSLFSTAVAACRLQGLRPMVVTPPGKDVMDRVPEGVGVFGFVPFAALLPRVRAVIHHAGHGTVTQALAAGIPQIGLPMAHDQFDNLARLRRLGCGDGITSSRASPSRLAAILGAALESPTIAAACSFRARQMEEANGIKAASDALERC